jgi:hypothetical protein
MHRVHWSQWVNQGVKAGKVTDAYTSQVLKQRVRNWKYVRNTDARGMLEMLHVVSYCGKSFTP